MRTSRRSVCVVHEADKSSGEREQRVDIYLNFIGKFDIPAPEPTPEEIAKEEKQRRKREQRREAQRRYAAKQKLKEDAVLKRDFMKGTNEH